MLKYLSIPAELHNNHTCTCKPTENLIQFKLIPHNQQLIAIGNIIAIIAIDNYDSHY